MCLKEIGNIMNGVAQSYSNIVFTTFKAKQGICLS